MVLVSACTSNAAETIFWRDKRSSKIDFPPGELFVFLQDAPKPKVSFEGIANGFGDRVAAGAGTGARHGAQLGQIGLYGSCVNIGCAVLLLVSAALAIGGSAIGAIVGAIDGGVDAVSSDEKNQQIAALQKKAMEQSLTVLSLKDDMDQGIRQQLHERPEKRYKISNPKDTKDAKKIALKDRQFFVHLSEIKAVTVDREGWVRLQVTVTGNLTYKQKAIENGRLQAQFISDAVNINRWFADDAKLFRDTLQLAARLSAAKLIAKLQDRLHP